MEFLKKLLAVLFATAFIGGSVSAVYNDVFDIDPDKYYYDEQADMVKYVSDNEPVYDAHIVRGYLGWYVNRPQQNDAQKSNKEMIKELEENIKIKELEKKIDDLDEPKRKKEEEKRKQAEQITCPDIARVVFGSPALILAGAATGAFWNRASGLCYKMDSYYCNSPNTKLGVVMMALFITAGYCCIPPTIKIAKKVTGLVIKQINDCFEPSKTK